MDAPLPPPEPTLHVGLVTDRPSFEETVAGALGAQVRLQTWRATTLDFAGADPALIELVAASELILFEWDPARARLLLRLQDQLGWSDVPVVVLCRHASDQELALLAGADFALVPPLTPLLVRSVAVAHRRRVVALHAFQAAQHEPLPSPSGDGSPLGGREPEVAGSHGVELSPRTLSAWIGGRWHQLSPRRFALLRYLVAHAGAVVTRDELLRSVWNVPFDPGSNAVDVYVHHLRRFLRTHGFEGRLETVRNVGYRLVIGPGRPAAGERPPRG